MLIFKFFKTCEQLPAIVGKLATSTLTTARGAQEQW